MCQAAPQHAGNCIASQLEGLSTAFETCTLLCRYGGGGGGGGGRFGSSFGGGGGGGYSAPAPYVPPAAAAAPAGFGASASAYGVDRTRSRSPARRPDHSSRDRRALFSASVQCQVASNAVLGVHRQDLNLIACKQYCIRHRGKCSCQVEHSHTTGVNAAQLFPVKADMSTVPEGHAGMVEKCRDVRVIRCNCFLDGCPFADGLRLIPHGCIQSVCLKPA